MMMSMIKGLGRTIGVDADDVRVIAVGIVVVLVVGVALVILGLFAGAAVAVFSLASGL